MNRIFHARVPWYTLFLLVLLLILTVWAYWERLGLVAMASLMFMVILVERTIHTCYTVTSDGKLLIDRGRFSKRLVIPLDEIHRMELLRSAHLGPCTLTRYLLIYYGQPEKSISLIPTDEEGLVTHIEKMKKR